MNVLSITKYLDRYFQISQLSPDIDYRDSRKYRQVTSAAKQMISTPSSCTNSYLKMTISVNSASGFQF